MKIRVTNKETGASFPINHVKKIDDQEKLFLVYTSRPNPSCFSKYFFIYEITK